MKKNEHILITVSGQDHPGITASLMNILVKENYCLSDMGQSVTHGLLSLSFLIEENTHENQQVIDRSIIKDLLFEAKNMGLTLEYQIIKNGEDTNKLTLYKKKFILSCVAVDIITPAFVNDISSLLAKNDINILRIDNISGQGFKSVEITTSAPNSEQTSIVQEGLLDISVFHQVDVAFLKDNIYRRSKRLIVFDMDSTLIQTEVIDEMAQIIGVGEEIKKITEEAMNGKLDFDQSLITRVSKLKGLSEKQMQQILANLPLTPGVEKFITVVKNLGYKTAIISGGFSFFANALKEKLGIDYAFANELEIENSVLTGRVKGTIINAQQKAMLVDLLAQQEKISVEQVVAIGDGANDLPMLSKAGLGIAFHAKEIVKGNASQQMSHGPMTSILYFLGITDYENI